MNESRCAVCQLSDGLVVNIIIASSTDPAPADCYLIEIIDAQVCDIGWTWNESEFIAPIIGTTK